jgi:mercuric ion transport protein
MKDKKTIKIGAIGSSIMALCCFTPLLVIALGTVGLSAWLVWLDFVLLPGLAIFLVILGVGIWQLKTRHGN